MVRAPDGDAAIAAVMMYLRKVGKREEDEVVMAVRKAVGDSVFDQIFHAGERLEQKGFERGIERGMERGKREGRRDTLARQLKLRFGELPASVMEVLDAATIEALDRMTDRILTASTLAEVLGTETPAEPKPVRKTPARKSPQRRPRGR